MLLTNHFSPDFSGSPVGNRLHRGLLQLICLLPLILASGGSQADRPSLNQANIETRVMRFPGIALDGIDYRALRFEYASRGDVAIAQTLPKQQRLQCDGKDIDREYLEVHYQGPDVLFRISDERNRRVVHQQKLDTSGIASYGEGSCDPEGDIHARFSVEQHQWLTELQKELLAEARREIQSFIEEDVALRYETVQLTLYWLNAQGNVYSEINEAYYHAREAFDLTSRLGVTVEGQETLRSAIETWEGTLKRLENGRAQIADSEQTRLALHRNLSVSYFTLGQHAKARRHDALALARGLPDSHSIQRQILAHERHQLLSPRVASDLVLTANLYRMGQSTVAGAELELEDYDTLKQALAHH